MEVVTGMELDRFSLALLVLRPDAPQLDEEQAAALQDAHMAHLAGLHDAGLLLASGPLLDERFRGLSIFWVEAEQACALKAQDPAVRAGRFDVLVMPWLVPSGVVAFLPGRLPRSMAEVEAGD